MASTLTAEGVSTFHPMASSKPQSWTSRRLLAGYWAAVLAVAVAVAVLAVMALEVWAERTLTSRKHGFIARSSTETMLDARMLRYQWEATLARTRVLHRLARELALAVDVTSRAEHPGPIAGAYLAMRQSEVVKALEFGHLGEFAQVALVDERAIVTWSTLPMPAEPIDLSGREHIQAVLGEGREWFVGTPVVGRVSGTFTIQVTAAVRDHLGQRRGASVVSLSVATLSNYLRDLSLGPRDRVIIARGDGMVLGANNEALIARPLPDPLRSLLHAAAKTEEAAETLAFGREVVVGSLAVPNEDMLVVVFRDVEAITEPVRQMGRDLQRQVRILQVAVIALGMLVILLMEMRAHAQRIQREQRRRELEARGTEAFARIAEAGPGVLYRLRPQPADGWSIDIMGAAVAEVTGYSVMEGCAPDWLVHSAHDDDRHELEEALPACFTGSGRTLEYRMRTRAGRWIWVQNTLHPSWDPEIGRVAIGYLLDITQRKEAALMVAQTSKLSTLGEMAAGMAHELNQPLATIAMAAENARDALALEPPGGAVVAEVLSRLDRIVGQAARAAKLIAHLRVFARREGESDRPVAVRDAVAGAILLLESRLRECDIGVELDLTEALPCVVGNQILLEQVLVNLMLNSIDAYERHGMEAVGADLTIRIAARLENAQVVLTVSDQAGGIEVSLQDRVFEPFFTTKPEGKGTGLGLSFSYGIVAGMKGSIHLANRDGGATFTIRLPVASGDFAGMAVD